MVIVTEVFATIEIADNGAEEPVDIGDGNRYCGKSLQGWTQRLFHPATFPRRVA